MYYTHSLMPQLPMNGVSVLFVLSRYDNDNDARVLAQDTGYDRGLHMPRT